MGVLPESGDGDTRSDISSTKVSVGGEVSIETFSKLFPYLSEQNLELLSNVHLVDKLAVMQAKGQAVLLVRVSCAGYRSSFSKRCAST